MKTIKKILLFPPLALLTGALGCAVWYLIATAHVSLDASALQPVQNCVFVYDRDNALIAECSPSGEDRTAFCSLPRDTVNAFIAAEDKHFFTHGGLDYKRMAKALWRNITSLSFREGASTISQQLVKNTQLSPEKTIGRKLREIKLTRQLEKRYSKEEILEMYLNTIYFGHNCYGIGSAAGFYFDCRPEDLSLAQSATLAGMVRSPNNYSPFKQPEKCRARRDRVLSAMESEGFITATQRRQAQAQALPERANRQSGAFQSYLDMVFSEAEEYIDENAYGGLKIYTCLDRELQKTLEKLSAVGDTDKSFCVIGNAEREVKAFCSTVGNASRLPASVIKPLLVYAPALEEDIISPATPIRDEETNFGGYSPRNSDGKYHGYVSAREALAKSYNVPAVRILNALGTEKAVRYTEKAGLPIEKDDLSLALALGGMKKGYPLLDLTAAYTVFARGGVYAPPSFIRRITDKNGNDLPLRAKNERRVFGEDTTTLINDMLSDVVQKGTARKLKNAAGGAELCAKTGTGGTDGGNTDAYCISYTSLDTVGVWLGNADGSPMKNISGGGLPANINGEIVRYLCARNSPPALPKSPGVADCILDKNEYEKNHKLVLCDPNAPVQEKTLHDLFKKSAVPAVQSDRFSRPSLPAPSVFVENNHICIVLCQTDYYTIVINREGNDGFRTVYRGKCIDKFIDKEAKSGESYVYSVTPYYEHFVGKTIILPRVRLPETSADPPSQENFIPKRNDCINSGISPLLCQTKYTSNRDKSPCLSVKRAKYGKKKAMSQNRTSLVGGMNLSKRQISTKFSKNFSKNFNEDFSKDVRKDFQKEFAESKTIPPLFLISNPTSDRAETIRPAQKNAVPDRTISKATCPACASDKKAFSEFTETKDARRARRNFCAFCGETTECIDWMKIFFPFVKKPFPLPLT